MNTKKIVVLADIESVRVPFTSFEKALKEVSKYGDVAGCKFYGYSAKRTKAKRVKMTKYFIAEA